MLAHLRATAVACAFTCAAASSTLAQTEPTSKPPPTALSGDELDGLAGGDGGVSAAVTQQNLQAVNRDNKVVANSVVSGGVAFDNGAFSNFAGLGNIVVNTGNNNNLQSTLSLNVVMPPR